MTLRIAVTLLVVVLLSRPGSLFAQDSPEEAQVAPNTVNSGLQLYGGLGVPLGSFSKSDEGAAMTGFGFGAQYTISLGEAGPFFENSGIALGATYTNNGADLGILSGLGLNVESGSYTNIWALGGLKTTLPSSESLSFDIAFFLGAAFSSSPSMTATGSGATVSLSSASATAFAWSAAGDVVLGKHFTFGLRYYESKPKYTITLRGEAPGVPAQTETFEAEQSTSILLVSVGYLF